MPFSATADGSGSAGTCSETDDCQAGPNSAMPLPTMKQNASNICGVRWPSQARTDKADAPVSPIDSETSATMRRSYMSAMAPAGIEISMIGSINAVCTSATLSASDVICVIAQAAPTPWINRPRLESRLASQMRRNTACRSGAATPWAANIERFGWSVMFGSICNRHCGQLILEEMPAKVLLCPVLRPSSTGRSRAKPARNIERPPYRGPDRVETANHEIDQ